MLFVNQNYVQMEEQEIEAKLKEIHERLARHEEQKGTKIEEQVQSLKSHTDRVEQKVMQVRELSNTGGFERKEKFYTKI